MNRRFKNSVAPSGLWRPMSLATRGMKKVLAPLATFCRTSGAKMRLDMSDANWMTHVHLGASDE
jgi:hypothetical protein